MTRTLSKALSSVCPQDWHWHLVPLSHPPAPSFSHPFNSSANRSKLLLHTSCPATGREPSFSAFSVLILISSGITALEKSTMGPLSAVFNSHPCRNSALIWCKNHLSNVLCGSNLGFFMWFFDKFDTEMSLACLWIKIRWIFKSHLSGRRIIETFIKICTQVWMVILKTVKVAITNTTKVFPSKLS